MKNKAFLSDFLMGFVINTGIMIFSFIITIYFPVNAEDISSSYAIVFIAIELGIFTFIIIRKKIVLLGGMMAAWGIPLLFYWAFNTFGK